MTRHTIRAALALLGALLLVCPAAAQAKFFGGVAGDVPTGAHFQARTASARHANLAVNSGRQAIEEAAEPLETRGIVVAERGRFRVRERTVLRYYARTIEHLLVTTGRTH